MNGLSEGTSKAIELQELVDETASVSKQVDFETEIECLHQPETKRAPVLTCYAAWSAVFASIAGLWQYGYSIGSINAAYLPVTNSIQQNYQDRYNTSVSAETVNAIWVVSSAAFPVGGIFGSLLVGPIVRRFGRLNGLIVGHSLTIVMSILAALSGIMESPEAIIISRIGIGISSAAIGTGITVMYVIEVSPRHLRGQFGSMVSVGIGLGLTMGNVLGLPYVLGNKNLWPILLLMTGVPSFMLVVLSKTMAESPRQKLIEDKDEARATKILQRLHGVSDVSKTLIELRKESTLSSSIRPITVPELIRSSELRRSVIAAVYLAAAQQVTGLNGVSFNMNAIYKAAGIDPDMVYYVSIGVTATVVILNLFAARLTESVGRKKLLMTSYTIIGLSLLLLVISIETQHLSPAMAYVSVAASMGYWVGFSCGCGPVTLMMAAEFFDQNSRSAAITLTSVSLWVFFTVNVIITPYMLAAIRGYTFLPFSIMAFLSVLYISIYVPETKNRPFTEIRNSFRPRTKKSEDCPDESTM